MNDVREVINLLREEVEKQLEVEQSAASFVTNVFLETYHHEGDEDDPTPSIIHGLPIDMVSRVMLVVAGTALAFQEAAEESYGEDRDEQEAEGGMAELDKLRWESYLDGVITLTSGLMGLALAVADSATAAGELRIADIIGGEDE